MVPLMTTCSCSGVIIFHSIKRATAQGAGIRLTTEILDYSFTRAVSSGSHVDCTSFLFTAMKSQLSEGQVCSQFFHGILRDEQRLVVVTVADFTVRRLNRKLSRGRVVYHNVRNKKPTSWKKRIKFGYKTRCLFQLLLRYIRNVTTPSLIFFYFPKYFLPPSVVMSP